MTQTFYLGGVLDTSILTTASDISNTIGATAVGKDTPLGTSTGYGELCPNHAPATWPAKGSEASVPWSGNGNIYPTDISNTSIPAGNRTPTLRVSVTGTGVSSITADLIVREWKYSANSNTATKNGIVTLAAQTISSTATTFNLPATSLGQVNFAQGEYVAYDVVANVTSNPNGSGVGTKIRVNFSNSATQGANTAQVVAPASVPARFIPVVAALSRPGYIPVVASIAKSPLATPYVAINADRNFMSTVNQSLRYKGRNVKLYGCTIYLSTQGGTAMWKTDLTSTLNSLFQAAYDNGLSMIRITDYFSSSDATQTFDDPQIWKNIDYCVTRAQQLGMFVMMDVSGIKAFLTSQGIDPTNAANWTGLLTLVGQHYKGTAPSICWYNLSGEPALPTDQAGVNSLAAFYNSLCNAMYAADGGTHLISAGGLTHMNSTVSGITDPTWWYQIFTLNHNDICGIKDYSVNDLAYMSTIQSTFSTYSINKPISCNEFGAQQEQGDASFPAFSNTLSAGITSGNTVTSLSLNTTIAQTVTAGTIIAVSGTENFVVASDTSSGTSLPVQSVTASANHSTSDSVSALGFADVGHSLGDTVDNFYKAVFGINTSIYKWNNTPRTRVNTSVLGGDQLGITSYVVWNLGYQVSGTGYDISSTDMPNAWAIVGSKARGDGYMPLVLTGGSYTTLINNLPATTQAGTLNIDLSIGKRGQASFLEYHANTSTHYQQYQQVQINDQNNNTIFGGYIQEPKERKPGFQAFLTTDMTCMDYRWITDKRVIFDSGLAPDTSLAPSTTLAPGSNTIAKIYTNRPYDVIVYDIYTKYLAPEGISLGAIFTGPYPSTTLAPSTSLAPNGPSQVISQVTFNYPTVTQAFDALATSASSSGVTFYWSIDQNKMFWFVPYSYIVNSALVDGTQIDNVNNPPYVERSNPLYRNTQYVAGGTTAGVPRTEYFIGNSNTRTWSLAYEVATQPSISLNNTSKSVGIQGASGRDYYFEIGSKAINQDTSGTLVTSTDSLAVHYVPMLPHTSTAQSVSQIAAQKALDGTTGIVESVVKDENVTSNTDGTIEAQTLLNVYSPYGTRFTFTTLVSGYFPGQQITVTYAPFNFSSTKMLIENVHMDDSLDSFNIWYTITAIIGPFDATWAQFFGKILAPAGTSSATSINVGI